MRRLPPGRLSRPSCLWTLARGLGAPAGVIFDPQTRELYLSQIGGEGDKKDGDGVITRVDLRGTILEQSWISGLNAPKGLALHERTLWTTDIDELVAIDVAKGKVQCKIAIEGAKFLTGLAVDPRGRIYVGDMLTSRIYCVEENRPRVLAQGRELESPGAILCKDGALLVAGWGYTTDYSTAVPGSIYLLNLKSRKQTPFSSSPRANWFGLCPDGNSGYFASDFGSGRVYRIDHSGKPTCVVSLPQGCAGLVYVPDAKLLVVTQTPENRVAAYDLSSFYKKP